MGIPVCMRVLICGGRKFNDSNLVVTVIRDLALYSDLVENDVTVVIHGDAPGADTLAGQAADMLGLPVEAYPADWKKYGNGAGHIRNRQMLEEGRPDLVIAFPGGKGTANMVKIAREAGIKVEEVTYNGSN